MLILTRRPGETIIVETPTDTADCTAESIQVTVLAIKGNQVRIGVAAPPEITILREELLERLEA
ncbi:Carbon storage regulator [hydrothermal vent metagenome]|uniref:Carbon storage regulator n=1 Tax=hydrothermal vent metagenome TaxID=652676 RepID=A0A3B0YBQ2_9ZZZZ